MFWKQLGTPGWHWYVKGVFSLVPGHDESHWVLNYRGIKILDIGEKSSQKARNAADREIQLMRDSCEAAFFSSAQNLGLKKNRHVGWSGD